MRALWFESSFSFNFSQRFKESDRMLELSQVTKSQDFIWSQRVFRFLGQKRNPVIQVLCWVDFFLSSSQSVVFGDKVQTKHFFAFQTGFDVFLVMKQSLLRPACPLLSQFGHFWPCSSNESQSLFGSSQPSVWSSLPAAFWVFWRALHTVLFRLVSAQLLVLCFRCCSNPEATPWESVSENFKSH